MTPSGPPWYLGDLADALIEELAAREQALRDEQAPHGLDEWDERDVQQALAARLRRDHEVTLEAHYPSAIDRRRSHRLRCDLVVSPPGRALEAEQALWLELKVARQRRTGGAADPRYAVQWRRHLIADLKKLAREPRIHAAAIVLVAFLEDDATLARDLDGFETVMIRQGVVAGFRQVRTTALQDRIGNRRCAVAMWPTVQ